MPITINTAKRPAPPPTEGVVGESAQTAEHHPKWFTALLEFAIIAVAVAVMFLVRLNIYDVAIVTSRSMEPTLLVGDRIVFDHRKSLQGTWKRFDVVFFEPPESWEDADKSLLVKRIIGMPGETVGIQWGNVIINGKTYQDAGKGDADQVVPPVTLGKDQYFVLGDNRGNSDDSRSHGPIGDKDIRGRAVYRMWPFGRRGGVGKLP